MIKNRFKFKRKDSGQILNIHHTITTSTGELKRIRFLRACFSDTNDFFASVDSRGNCNIFDLKNCDTWVWQNKFLLCSVLKFAPKSTGKIIAGTRSGGLMMLDVATGDLLHSIHPFVAKINNVSFPSSNADIFLATTNTDAIIFNLHNFQQKHRLEYPAAELTIKQMKFLNNSDQIYSIFSNNTIHIWTHDNFQPVERVHPIRVRENFLKNSQPQRIDFNTHMDEDTALRWNVTKDYTRGLISDVCFSNEHMCVATIDDYLMVFDVATWEIMKLIRSPGTPVLHVQFVPIADAPDKMLISLVTLTKDTILLDLNNINEKFCVQEDNTLKVDISKNSAMMAILLRTGEIKMFDTSVFIAKLKIQDKTSDEDIICQQQWNGVNDKIRKILPPHRLQQILKEYLEYPSDYRPVIWKNYLQLPDNRNAFTDLIKKGYHPCVKNYDELYPLNDLSTHRNLKRVVSALAYWSKVFAQCDFIPKFVFPFVKEFDKNLIFCFELIATILLNHGQLWFEFAPLEPFNYLGMVQNILSHYEPQLLKFYVQQNVTSKTFAWSLLQSAFTEVMDEDQWRQLWDHIITNVAEFLIFTVVAYNIVMKDVIMRLDSKMSVERFFEEQNLLDMKRLIRTTYDIMDKCPDKLRPSQYFKKFTPLNEGFYQKFTNFPRSLISAKDKEVEKLMAENRVLNDKLFELEKRQLAWANRLESTLKAEEHTKRMKAVEKAYEDRILLEQDRVAMQRKQLLLYQKQLRDSEQNMVQEARSSVLRRNLLEKESDVELLSKRFDRIRIKDEANLLFAEEDLKVKEMELLVKKYNLDKIGDVGDIPLSVRYQKSIEKLENEIFELEAEMRKVSVFIKVKLPSELKRSFSKSREI
ncbi:TBC1 domain family member 31 [Pseudolycoriella hygida]|uniref:TBC1 domain family member 31 n=1 Tax=Pseudolycoriella hygida TaxID=35572 RepID=A0A9Q0N0F7_9DIPT|nr:TBC1 domain family member 31 [Pseudolycoriella hygida]